ncbi:hypothetical protein A6R68_09518, partial [Neotoma lepida]
MGLVHLSTVEAIHGVLLIPVQGGLQQQTYGDTDSFGGSMAFSCLPVGALMKVHVVAVYTLEEIKEKYIARFTGEISKLSYLQHLFINGFYFSSEHMKQLFIAPWSLSIKVCEFFQSDLEHLPQCHCLFQLKHLKLLDVALFNLFPTVLQVLLKSVADTLQTLELENFRIGDSQLSALLPALSQCLQLTRVNVYNVVISMSILKDLLQCLAILSKLTEDLYQYSIECYDKEGHVLVNKFVNVCSILQDTPRAKGYPTTVSFATD